MKRLLAGFFIALWCLLPILGHAADNRALRVELNRIAPSKSACELTFVTQNELGAGLSKTAFEMVFFDKSDLVERMLTLNFGALASSKTVVKQFAMPDMDCNRLSRVLINQVATCQGADISLDFCNAHLETTNRSTIAFGK